MANNAQTTVRGIGFSSILGIVFIVLKLLGKITWSWFWVLAPFWISWSIVILLLLLEFMIFILANR
jgi:hypothetical protein